jgi:catechol-2,3-dioxygenase
MAIQRVESITYGVDDVATGTKFFDDLGLEKVEAGAKGAVFRTPTNQFVNIRPIDDASLPKAPEQGNTNRETLWGVDSKESLEKLGAELSKDREVKRTPDGVLHTRDETGFAIAFGVSNPTEAPEVPLGYNAYRTTGRVNERARRQDKISPTRIGHVVYLIKNDDDKQKASSFYLDRLGFKLTDRAMRVGDFMRVGGTSDHHAMLLMWVRQQVVRFDHVAFECPAHDDILASGPLMQKQGWQPCWGPGRQSLGSHLFYHFVNPCGGEVELFTDMDRFDDQWEPKVWTDATPGPAWMHGEAPQHAGGGGMGKPGAPMPQAK